MSQPVETAIRTHLQANDALQETIEWAEIVSRLEGGPPLAVVPRRSSRRGLWVAAAAVVITILLIGVTPFLLNNDDPPVADTVVPTTLGESTPTTLATEVVPTTLDETVVPTTVQTGSANPEVTDVIDVGGWPYYPLVAADGAFWLAEADTTGSVVRIDATTLQVTDTISVGEDPTFMFPTEDGLWVLDIDGGELFLIDTATRQVVDSIRVLDRDGQAITPVLVDQTLWVHTNVQTPMVVEVDLVTRTVVSETRIGGNAPWWAGELNGAIWSHDTNVLKRFDLETHESEEVAAVDLGHHENCCFVFDDAIWMVDHDGVVHRFDPATSSISDSIEIGENLDGAIAAAGAVWVSAGDHGGSGFDSGSAGSVYRIDLESRQITDVIPVGSSPWTPAFADGAIWVPNGGDGTVSRIDVETRQVTHTIQVGTRPVALSVIDGAIWVQNLGDGTITRIKTR